MCFHMKLVLDTGFEPAVWDTCLQGRCFRPLSQSSVFLSVPARQPFTVCSPETTRRMGNFVSGRLEHRTLMFTSGLHGPSTHVVVRDDLLVRVLPADPEWYDREDEY